MLLVNESNILSQPFKNVREILLTNSNSVKVTPSYSKKGVIPTIIVEDNYDAVTQHFSGEDTYIAEIDIIILEKTVKKAATLSQECFDLIKAAEMQFNQYNMDLQGTIFNKSTVEINKNKINVWTLTCRFVIN